MKSNIKYYSIVALLLLMSEFSCKQQKSEVAADEPKSLSLTTVMKPVSTSVIASVSTVHPLFRTLSLDIKADGYMDYDTRDLETIGARFGGRIEKLYVRYN